MSKPCSYCGLPMPAKPCPACGQDAVSDKTARVRAAAPALAEALRRAIRGGRLIQAAFDGTDGADVPTVAATEIVGQGRAALAAAGIEA